MRANAIFKFELSPSTNSQYLLREHRGESISRFPAAYVKNDEGYKAGDKYINVRPMADPRLRKKFEHCISLENSRMCTGFNISPEFPLMAYGNYAGHAVLIQLSEDRKKITLFFYKNMRDSAASLFQRWIAGEIPETAVTDALPLEPRT